MASIWTTDGTLVFEKKGESGPPLSVEEAEASVKDRNKRAEDMGLLVRYEVRNG